MKTENTTPARKLVSIRQAVEQLPYGKSLFYDEMRRGHFKRTSVGGRVFIVQASIDEYLERLINTAENGSESAEAPEGAR